MNRSVVGVVLIALLACAGIGAFKLISPRLARSGQYRTSDAKDGVTIRFGGDGYLGYWFITSPEMKKAAARSGINIDFSDDGGAYAQRLEKFAKKELDAVVLPINSYLQHGAAYQFPGVIVAALAASKGADGIVGFADKFPQGKPAELNDYNLRIVYTPDSPSSFLLDLTVVDFDLFNLSALQTWRVDVNGSKAVYEKAKRHEGDAFVLWEPDLSKALSEVPDLKYIWGSDKFDGYITDVFVFHRDFLSRNDEAIRKFFEQYFLVMRNYSNNRDALMADIKKSTGLKPEEAEAMLKKIDWYDLQENYSTQFGIQTSVDTPAVEGVVNTIISCTEVLLRTGKLDKDPLEGNPYTIINSSILQKLKDSAPTALGRRDATKVVFAPLDEVRWKSLKEVGAMRVEPISFQLGQGLLDETGKANVDKIAGMLVNNYPDYRIFVRGHTAPGDEEANRILSQSRADTVVQYLTAVHGIDPNRLRAEGLGSTQPPVKKPGENQRSYLYRYPRVEFVLVEEHSL